MPEDAQSSLGAQSPSTPGGSPPAVPPPFQPAKDSPYYGYGGWLALFCAVQIFLVPLLALTSLAVSVSSVSLASIGDLGVAGFGVYAGLTLRRLRPGAVRTAKRFLLTFLVWSFLKLALPYTGGALPPRIDMTGLAILSLAQLLYMGVALPPRMLVAVAAAVTIRGVVSTLIAFAIWFSYFNVSKRVKATFPEG